MCFYQTHQYKINMKIKFIAVMALLMCALGLQAQTADEILAKYFANTGGLAKWKSLKTMKMTGKLTMQGMDLPVVFYSKTPDKKKMTIQVQNIEIVQAYDGTDAWMLNPMMGGKDPVKMSGEEAKELDQKFEDEFIDYAKKGHEVKLLGTEEVDGVKCYKIQLIKNKNNDKEDVTEVHYFDTENYVPILRVTYARSGPAKGQEIKTYLSDYQEVNGLMIPFYMESKVAGQTIQKVSVTEIKLDENMDDNMFIFPKK